MEHIVLVHGDILLCNERCRIRWDSSWRNDVEGWMTSGARRARSNLMRGGGIARSLLRLALSISI